MSSDRVRSVSEFNEMLEERTGVSPDLFWQRLREQRMAPDYDLIVMSEIGKVWNTMYSVVNRLQWRHTPEGGDFWSKVAGGRNPYHE